MPGLGLRHELHLHLEVILDLVESLHQGVDQRVALGLGYAELEADRRGTPGAARAEQRLLPPLELGGGDGAGGSHGLEQDTAGEDPMFVHRVPPIDSSVRDWG